MSISYMDGGTTSGDFTVTDTSDSTDTTDTTSDTNSGTNTSDSGDMYQYPTSDTTTDTSDSLADQQQTINEENVQDQYNATNAYITNETYNTDGSNRTTDETTNTSSGDNDSPDTSNDSPSGDMSQYPYSGDITTNSDGGGDGMWGDTGVINLGDSGPGEEAEMPADGSTSGEMAAIDIPDSLGGGFVGVNNTGQASTVNDAISDIMNQVDEMDGDASNNNRGDDGSGNSNSMPNPFNAIDSLPISGNAGMAVLGLVALAAVGVFLL